MSGLIFVALFVGWAVYLIPKFMREHEDLATTRTLQDFSARVRVFAATRTMPKMDLYGPDEPTIEIAMAEVETMLGRDARRPLPSRTAAKKAAQRRRRVLLVLLMATTVVGLLAGARIAPLWTPVIPVALVLVFLMSARRSVRRMNAARRSAARRLAAPVAPPVRVEAVPEIVEEVLIEAEVSVEDEAPAEANRLWDPVPMTLPTYIDKPVARRTVLGIDLNHGVVSSGHDAADSEMVRAAEAAAMADDTPVDLEAPLRAAGA